MKKCVLIVSMFLFCCLASAQEGAVLRSVEEKNKELQTLRKQGEARKLENRTGLTLSAPEVGFDYLWGSPSEIGSRKDFNVTQRFDLSTIVGSKRALSDARNRMVDELYGVERRRLLLQVRFLCVNMVYNNIRLQEMNRRLADADELAKVYASRLAKGDANVLEYNKAQLNRLLAAGRVRQVEVDAESLLSELVLLNGGDSIHFDAEQYEPISLPENQDSFYAEVEANNPQLHYAMAEVECGERQLRLNRTDALPTLSAGYMGEWVSDENYQGATFGLSIPLWTNKNKVKQSKAAVVALTSQLDDVRTQLRVKVVALYKKTAELRLLAEEYRNMLMRYNSQELLKKSLDAGQISLLEYLTEVTLYYEAVDLQNAAERDYRLALSELLWY